MAKKAAPRGKNDVLGGTLLLHSEEDRAPEEKRDGAQRGLTTGLVITHFCNELFQRNYEDQLDDDQLMDILLAEFPNRATVQSIRAYRGYFNGGQHGFGPFSVTDQNRALVGDERLGRVESEAEAKEKQAKKDAKEAERAAKKAETKAAKDADKARKEAAAAKSAPKAGPATAGAKAPKAAPTRPTPPTAPGVRKAVTPGKGR